MKYTHNKKVQGFYPIHQFRFNTENHPIIVSQAKRMGKLVVPLSHNEKLMLEGLANTLKCDKNEAARIAVYEFIQQDAVPDEIKQQASSATTIQFHGNRRCKLNLKLPAKEKPGKFLGLTEKEAVRAAIIWLRNRIRNDEVQELTNSPVIPIEELAKEWSRAHDGQEGKSSLRKMKEVREDNAETTRLINEAERHMRFCKTSAFQYENEWTKYLVNQELLEWEDVQAMANAEADRDQLDFMLETLHSLSVPCEDEEQMSDEELEELVNSTFTASLEAAQQPLEFKFSSKVEGSKPASQYTDEEWDATTKQAVDEYLQRKEITKNPDDD